MRHAYPVREAVGGMVTWELIALPASRVLWGAFSLSLDRSPRPAASPVPRETIAVNMEHLLAGDAALVALQMLWAHLAANFARRAGAEHLEPLVQPCVQHVRKNVQQEPM